MVTPRAASAWATPARRLSAATVMWSICSNVWFSWVREAAGTPAREGRTHNGLGAGFPRPAPAEMKKSKPCISGKGLIMRQAGDYLLFQPSLPLRLEIDGHAA